MHPKKSNSREFTRYLIVQALVAGLFFVPKLWLDASQGLPLGLAVVLYVAESIILAIVMFPAGRGRG
jgi:hypothetical protein